MSRRVLKMSGEAIADPDGESIVDETRLLLFARQVSDAMEEDSDLQVGIVVGGGNIARGKSLKGIQNRTRADHMGMLATVINGLALQDALEKCGLQVRVMTGLEVPKVAEAHIYGRAIKHFEKGRVVVFAGGTGSTHQTTDSAAALRACEMHADELLLAKYQTQGVYSADPNVDATARLFSRMSYDSILVQGLEVMDWNALAYCKDNRVPIYVFDMQGESAVREALLGRHHFSELGGTLIAQGAADEYR